MPPFRRRRSLRTFMRFCHVIVIPQSWAAMNFFAPLVSLLTLSVTAILAMGSAYAAKPLGSEP
jgi:hypothetical protein